VAQFDRCAELPGVDLTTVQLAANVEPYICADGTKVWSLRQLERQLRPEAYRTAGTAAAASTADERQPPTHRNRDGPVGIARSFQARETASLSGTFAGYV
jgi:hypothetical protein